MTSGEQREAAKQFAAKWAGKGYEKGECQKFWRSLLHDVFGIEDPDDWVDYEIPLATGYVDAYISRTKVLIEQKSFSKGVADKQALDQAFKYAGAAPGTMPVRYVVLCNFSEFRIYDKHSADMKPVTVKLSDLPKKLSILRFLTEVKQPVSEVRAVSLVDEKAAYLVGKLYNLFLDSYVGEKDERLYESLNQLCVRLVFCAYAEDSGVFPNRDQFVTYMRRYGAEAFRDRLKQLFRILNTDYKDRDPEDIPDLLAFPYVGSKLFADEEIRIPRFTEELRTMLLDEMCADVNWTEINPTIFGSVFESTLSTAMRRKNGMHYTSIENIHRVIDPLFFWELERELDGIAAIQNVSKRNDALLAFQEKLGKLRFLDPACGSGNFLTETYLSLRRLENKAIALRQNGQNEFDLGDVIKVKIDQFYGIEIDDFAVSVAQTALWIAESQMILETEEILHSKIDFLPLRRYAHIVRGNSVRVDWGALLPDGAEFDFIIGNPPFIGYSNQSEEQKADMLETFVDEAGHPLATAGKIDYVAAWYWKAARYMIGRRTRTAFVSTNSIVQGEQVAAIWQPLKSRFGVIIEFAWRTFVWNSQANEKAHVHVVIIGFSSGNRKSAVEKRIFEVVVEKDEHGKKVERVAMSRAARIDGYLYDAVDVFLPNRGTCMCDVPSMTSGNRPADGGHLIIEGAEYSEFVKKEPDSVRFIKRLCGSEEMINAKKRYCLWLVDVSPGDIRRMPEVMKRVEACRQDRLAAPDPGRRKLAERPTLFRETMNPSSFIVVPNVSSESRRYIPMDFFGAETIPTNLVSIIPGATIYHFGVLTSSTHMAWVRAVCGRLKSDYRYSAKIVYNNFPWPTPTEEQQRKIEQTAQRILDIRKAHPDCSLADLYAEPMMAYDLKAAHEDNDRAVMDAYGFDYKLEETEVVAKLFERYKLLAGEDDQCDEYDPAAVLPPEISNEKLPPDRRPITSGEFMNVHQQLIGELANLRKDVTGMASEMHGVKASVESVDSAVQGVSDSIKTVQKNTDTIIKKQAENASTPKVKPGQSVPYKRHHYDMPVDVAAAAMGMSKRELERILAGEIQPPDGFPGLDSRSRFELWVPGYRKTRSAVEWAKKEAEKRKWGSGKPRPEKPDRA